MSILPLFLQLGNALLLYNSDAKGDNKDNSPTPSLSGLAKNIAEAENGR